MWIHFYFTHPSVNEPPENILTWDNVNVRMLNAFAAAAAAARLSVTVYPPQSSSVLLTDNLLQLLPPSAQHNTNTDWNCVRPALANMELQVFNPEISAVGTARPADGTIINLL